MGVQRGACAGDSHCPLTEAELWIDTLSTTTGICSAFSKLEASEASLKTGQKKHAGYIKADDRERVSLSPVSPPMSS